MGNVCSRLRRRFCSLSLRPFFCRLEAKRSFFFLRSNSLELALYEDDRIVSRVHIHFWWLWRGAHEWFEATWPWLSEGIDHRIFIIYVESSLNFGFPFSGIHFRTSLTQFFVLSPRPYLVIQVVNIPTIGAAPSARVFHCLVKLNDTDFVVIGGRGSPKKPAELSDFYRFSLLDNLWSKITISGPLPKSLWRHTSTRVIGGPYDGKILIYGGRSCTYTLYSNDSWLLLYVFRLIGAI